MCRDNHVRALAKQQRIAPTATVGGAWRTCTSAAGFALLQGAIGRLPPAPESLDALLRLAARGLLIENF